MTTGSNHDIVEKLEELALRCEAATGPDRELDCEILAAIDWRETDWEQGDRTVREMVKKRGIAAFEKSAGDVLSTWRHLPRLTASLDAAMSLVPEGWWLHSMLGRSTCEKTDVVLAVSGAEEVAAHACSATPALALTAAALRARALQSKDTHDE
jgi:hypothetical protein